MIPTASSLNSDGAVRFRQLKLSGDTVIDLRVDKRGDQFVFFAMEWTVKAGGVGSGAFRVPEESYSSEKEAVDKFDQYVDAWS